ncbi:MAG TPA: hypothetical protein VF344_01685 [Candidatus Limnocylindrales bacterium]
MPGQTDRTGAGQTGPVGKRGAVGRAQTSICRRGYVAVPMAVRPAPGRFVSDAMVGSTTSPLGHCDSPRPFETSVAYRELVDSGFTGPEAMGLIGYLAGLAPCESGWSLLELNLLLFLRNGYRGLGWDDARRACVRGSD